MIVNSVENQLNRLVLCVREVDRISEINFDGIERTVNALVKSQPHNLEKNTVILCTVTRNISL